MAQTAETCRDLRREIRACSLCEERFAKTTTAHRPRPVAWFGHTARLLIAGQAPGARVHASGVPFDDPSGQRLRDWLGIDRDMFYDTSKVAIVPMGFCFPGYSASGSDLPPPAICRQTWHDRVLACLPELRLRVVVGGYAQKYHLNSKDSVTHTVRHSVTRAASFIAISRLATTSIASCVELQPMFPSPFYSSLASKM